MEDYTDLKQMAACGAEKLENSSPELYKIFILYNYPKGNDPLLPPTGASASRRPPVCTSRPKRGFSQIIARFRLHNNLQSDDLGLLSNLEEVINELFDS